MMKLNTTMNAYQPNSHNLLFQSSLLIIVFVKCFFVPLVSQAQTVPEITSIKINGESMTISGDEIILTIADVNSSFNFEMKVKNKGDDSPNGNNWTTVSFPSFTSSSDQYNVSTASGTSSDFVIYEYLGYDNLTTGGTNSNYVQWLTAEASDELFRGGCCWSANVLSLDIIPKRYGTFYIYYRVQMFNGDGVFSKLPTTGYSGPIGEPNYRIKVVIIEPNYPPSSPSNPDPTNGATNVSINSDLDWSSSSDPNGDNIDYKVYFGTDPTPDNGEYQGVASSSYYSLSTLDFDEHYYWKIKAFDGNGGETVGPIWDFYTEINNPPNTPSNPNPSDNATSVSINPSFSWNGGDPDGDNVTYTFRYKKGTLGSWTNYTTSNTFYSLISLDFIQNYYWKVVAEDEQGEITKSHSDIQNGWKFTTEINNPPFKPGSPNPSDNATSVSINPSFSWNGGDPDGDDVSYLFRYKKGTLGGWNEFNTNSQTYSLNGLEFGQDYYWKVYATDEHGEETKSHSITSHGWKFTTEVNNAPNTPSNPNPADNEENISINPTFSWAGGDPDGDDVSYLFRYKKGTLGSWNEFNTNSQTYSLNGLEFGQDYYWKVYATDEHGEETKSHSITSHGWKFTCEDAPFTQLAQWQNESGNSITSSNVCKNVTLKTTISGNTSGNLTAKILDKDGLFQKDDPISSIEFIDKGNGHFEGIWETIWIDDKLFSGQAPQNQEQTLSTESELFSSHISELYFEIWDGDFKLGRSDILKVEDLDNPEAPVLNVIDDDDIVEYSSDSKLLNPFDNNKMDIPFSWNSSVNEDCQSGIEKYRIEVSDDENFESIIKSDVLNDTQKTFSLPIGTYYWRVAARDEANNPSDWNDANWSTKSLVIKTPYILRITEVRPTVDIGEKQPLLLVHGWQFEGIPDSPDPSIWNNFINYFEGIPELENNFKLYYVNYYSNYVSVQILGDLFRKEFEQLRVANFPSRSVSIVSHSMGGLVSKVFMYSTDNNVQGGEYVSDLITLGTPHHGSPMANGPARKFPYLIYVQILDPLLNARVQFVEDYLTLIGSPTYLQVNRSDMRWDNFDDLFAYNLFTNEQNNWLEQLNQQSNYDYKITAYSGNEGKQDITSGSQNFAYEAGYDYMKAIGLKFNDGIVPKISAEFEGHDLKNRRFFDGYNHTMIGSGDGTSALFQAIESDLVGDSESIITISPNIIAFGNTLINNSVEQIFSITNNGSVVLSISDLVISGNDAAEFSIDNNQSLEFDIAVGETKELRITFSPTTVGEKSTVLYMYNNSSNASPNISIELNGACLESVVKTLEVVSESPLIFGDVLSHNSSIDAIYIKNTGTSDLTISQLNLIGTDSDEFSIVVLEEESFDIAPNEIKQIFIKFIPSSVGQKTAFLVITNNSDNSPELTIELTGTGQKQPSNLATLSDILIDGMSIANFDFETLYYEVVLTKNATAVPSVSAITTNEDAILEITETQSLPGNTLIIVTSEDGTTTLTYTVDFLLAPNNKPFAVDDSYSIDEDEVLEVQAPGVLSNDSDEDGDELSAILVSDVTNGSISLNSDGSFTYEPASNFNGSDSFTYKASDGSADSLATVSITVKPVNDNPVAVDDSYSIDEDEVLEVQAPGVLSNDSDEDADELSAILVSDVANGSLSLNADGSFTYEPNPNLNGSDSFTYKASDGSTDSTAIVSIAIVPLDDAPINILLSSDTISENREPGVVIGILSTIDEDEHDMFTYTIESESESELFEINVDQLLAKVSFDFEESDTQIIEITTTDQGGLTYTKPFTIIILDIDEPLGIDEFRNDIVIYPNPTKDYLVIRWNNFSKATISELSGKELLKVNTRTLDLRTLNTGVYLLTLEGMNNERITFRIIKE